MPSEFPRSPKLLKGALVVFSSTEEAFDPVLNPSRVAGEVARTVVRSTQGGPDSV
jgi:hypothetical protein